MQFLSLPKLVLVTLLLCSLAALVLCAPKFYEHKKYSKAARGGRRNKVFGNLINVDPWAFPNSFPYPSIPVRL
jgi:hypothetical protein